MQIYNTDYICDSFASKKEIDVAAMKSLVKFNFDTAHEEMKEYTHLQIHMLNFATFFYPLKRLVQLREKLKEYMKDPTSSSVKYLPWKPNKIEEFPELLKRINKLIDEDYVVYKNNKAERKRVFARKLEENKKKLAATTPDGTSVL